VYAFGPKKPPYCMSCAMVAGGVKTSASRPAMSRRDMKAHVRMLKAELKAEAKEAAKAAKSAPIETVDVPATPGESTDWSTPWWEDRQPTALAD
jgi:hypothetical protein